MHGVSEFLLCWCNCCICRSHYISCHSSCTSSCASCIRMCSGNLQTFLHWAAEGEEHVTWLRNLEGMHPLSPIRLATEETHPILADELPKRGVDPIGVSRAVVVADGGVRVELGRWIPGNLCLSDGFQICLSLLYLLFCRYCEAGARKCHGFICLW